MEPVPLTAAGSPPLSRRGWWGRRAALAALVLTVGAGCESDKFGKKKDTDWKLPPGLPTTPMSSTLTSGGSNDVVPAGATTPAGAAPSPSFSIPGFGKSGKDEKKVPAAEMTVLWRNKVDFLPNPAANGQMGPGLVGQMFLFGPRMEFASPEGKLTVALYDETPRPPGVPPQKPVGWEFTKDVLKGLKTPDERFGMSYALFLPWPEYRPDVTRVRIAVRFDPEQGFPLYAPETRITLDTGKVVAGSTGWTNQPFAPGPAGAQPSAPAQPAGGFSPLGGPPPGSGPAAAGPGGPGMGVMVTGGGPAGGFAPQPTGGLVPSAGPMAPVAPMMPQSPAGAGPVMPPAMPNAALAPAPPGFGALAPAPGPSPARPANPADLSNLPPIAFTAPRR